MKHRMGYEERLQGLRNSKEFSVFLFDLRLKGLVYGMYAGILTIWLSINILLADDALECSEGSLAI